jgi:hypothetical protein
MASRSFSSETGTPLKFIHCADLHLDSPFRGIFTRNQKIFDHVSTAAYAAFESIIDHAIAHDVDFLLVAGDSCEGVDRSVQARLRLRRGFERLSRENISTFVVRGDRDPLDEQSARQPYPKLVHVFSNTPEAIPFERDGEQVARVVGASHPSGAVTANLVRGFPAKAAEWPATIGLVHCSLGPCGDHRPCAPCALEDLVPLGYDYWALGHVHEAGVLSAHRPAVVYAGTPQGREIGEDGPRGCYLVGLDGGTVSAAFLETDRVRWCTYEVAIDPFETVDQLKAGIAADLETLLDKAGGRSLICRLVLTGSGPLHAAVRDGRADNLLDALRIGDRLEPPFVWVERIIEQTRPRFEHDDLLARQDFLGDLLRLSDGFRSDPEKHRLLLDVLSPILSTPRWERCGDFDPSKDLGRLVEDAESILVERIRARDHAY